MSKELSPTAIARIEQWVKETKGKPFTLSELRELHGIDTKEDRAKFGSGIDRLLTEKQIIERLGRGLYRLIPLEEPEIDLTKVDSSNFFPCRIPLGNVCLDDYVVLYRKSPCVIAGVTNAGKTSFLLNLIKANMDWHNIYYFFSEGGGEQLVDRLQLFGGPIEDWHFHPIPRTSNFVESIRPDDFNIIDFLSEEEAFYNIDRTLRDIIAKLDKGICWIAIQKSPFAKVGVGGHFSEDRAQLYLIMENNTLRIKKAKKWKDLRVNPNNMKWNYKLIYGAKFVNVGRCYSQEEL